MVWFTIGLFKMFAPVLIIRNFAISLPFDYGRVAVASVHIWTTKFLLFSTQNERTILNNAPQKWNTIKYVCQTKMNSFINNFILCSRPLITSKLQSQHSRESLYCFIYGRFCHLEVNIVTMCLQHFIPLAFIIMNIPEIISAILWLWDIILVINMNRY